jgi:replication factor C small subunit
MKRLLVEEYRPTTLSEYVFQDTDIEYKIKKWIKVGAFPNVLFSGTQGCGKTTMSRLLVSELSIQDNDVLTVNASTLTMAYIREVLEPWMKRSSFSPFKVVQLEESDRLTQATQQALRQIIEDHTDNVRWIATCNYPTKIIPALHSRFQHLEMSAMNMDGILDLIVDIIQKEELTVNDDESIMTHVDTYAPDIRKIIQSIDEHTDEERVLHPISGGVSSADMDEFEAIWVDGTAKKSMDKLLKLSVLIDQSNYEEFFEIMYTHHHNYDDVASGIILLSTYLDRATRVANQRLNLDAFLYHAFVFEDGE